MKQAGLNLRKWNSNSKELLAKIKELESEPNAETITKISSKMSESEPVIEDDQSFVKASIGQSGDDKALIGIWIVTKFILDLKGSMIWPGSCL